MNTSISRAVTTEIGSAGHLDLLALLPCPVKVPFEAAFNEFLGMQDDDHGALNCCLEGHANHHLSFYDGLDRVSQPNQLPGMMITPGVNRFMGQKFKDAFVRKGVYMDLSQYYQGSYAADLKMIDPLGAYFLLAINPLVIVADHRRLGDLPLPVCWSDLLDRKYQGQIVMRGQKNTFCETVLFSFYRRFGLDGIVNLATNQPLGCHPAEMAKHAGSPESMKWPAISLMPLFFANTIVRKQAVSIIWPEDGAIASPVTLMVQNSKFDRLQGVLRFLTGPIMAQLWRNAYFIPTYSNENDQLSNKPLQWLGWDFIHDADAHGLFNELNELFCTVRAQVAGREVI